MIDPDDLVTPIAPPSSPGPESSPPAPQEAAREAARALLARLQDAARTAVQTQALQSEQDADDVARACRGIVGAILAGDSLSAIADRYAVLRLLPAQGLIPWREVNQVIEDAHGEEGLETVKITATNLTRDLRLIRARERHLSPDELGEQLRTLLEQSPSILSAVRVPNAKPAASVKRGEPSYSQRLTRRAARQEPH